MLATNSVTTQDKKEHGRRSWQEGAGYTHQQLPKKYDRRALINTTTTRTLEGPT